MRVGSKTETFPVVWAWSGAVDFIDSIYVDTIYQVSQLCVVIWRRLVVSVID